MSLAWNVQMLVSWLYESLSVSFETTWAWVPMMLFLFFSFLHTAAFHQTSCCLSLLWLSLLIAGVSWTVLFPFPFPDHFGGKLGALVLAVLLGCSRGWRCSISRHWSLCIILREVMFSDSWNKFRKGRKMPAPLLVRYLKVSSHFSAMPFTSYLVMNVWPSS